MSPEDATAEDLLRYAVASMLGDLQLVVEDFAGIIRALDDGQPARAVQMVHELTGLIRDDLGQVTLPDRIAHVQHVGAAFAWDSVGLALTCCKYGAEEEATRVAEAQYEQRAQRLAELRAEVAS